MGVKYDKRYWDAWTRAQGKAIKKRRTRNKIAARSRRINRLRLA